MKEAVRNCHGIYEGSRQAAAGGVAGGRSAARMKGRRNVTTWRLGQLLVAVAVVAAAVVESLFVEVVKISGLP